MGTVRRHVLPGESGGDTAWFDRQNAFEQSEILRQVAYKRNHWPKLEDGRFSKRPDYAYPHILPSGHENLAFYGPLGDAVLQYMKDEDIALHTEALNLKSSQVACLNILFPLRQNLDLAVDVFGQFFPQLKSVSWVEFEYTGPDEATKWMGEPKAGKRGQNRTSIDASVKWIDDDGKSHVSLIEWKYTEHGFGQCSAFQSAEKDMKGRCRSLNVATDPEPAKACLLTDGGDKRSRRYWEHMDNAGVSLNAFTGISGCPFQGPLYQLMRQFLLARYVVESGEANYSDVVSIGFSGNSALPDVPVQLRPLQKNKNQDIVEVWNSVLNGVPEMHHITVEKLMEAFDGSRLTDNDWRDYIRERYGV